MKDRLTKDAVLTVTIDDISSDGSGIGHVPFDEPDASGRGYTLFIKDAVIGDTVSCRIMKAKKSYAYARLLEVVKPSKVRVTPRCENARACGGCQIQAMAYEEQLRYKKNTVRNDLIRIGGFDDAFVDSVLMDTVGMDDPFRYRNKAQYPVGEKNGKPIAGFYAGRTHSIIPVKDCLIGDAKNAEIMACILTWMERYHIPAYHEESGKGLIRHVLIRTGIYSGEIMVCLIVNGDKVPKEEVLCEHLAKIQGMTSISLNTNTAKTNVIMGQKLRTLWGSDTIHDSLSVYDVSYGADKHCTAPTFERRAGDAPLTFGISPLSFYQVNPRQTEKLYSIALQFAGLTGNEIVWDLYCGVGTISLFLARYAKSVYGVEVIPEAIVDARKNAEQNGITNATFEVGKVEDVLPDYVKQNGLSKGDIDVVVVDPPRKGCDEKCLETILLVEPKRIVYVSCDPATLARDLRILTEDGRYEIKKVQPTDQFSNTVHIENVVLLERKA